MIGLKKNLSQARFKVPVWFLNFLTRVLPTKADDPQTLLFKKIGWALAGMLFLTFFLAASVFVLTLKGEEETMVPKIVGEDLVTAIQELQDKELIPQVQVKFSDDPREKGEVVGQDPQGGILVKAGRRITLWVSKGAIVDKIENYVGQNVNDVQLHLKSLFANQSQALIRMTDSPVYVFNDAPEGTILEQKPLPGTPLASSVDLNLVISRGPKGQTFRVGSYVGQNFTDSLKMLADSSIPFVFKVRKAEGNEQAGKVVSQNPAPGSDVPKGTLVNLVMASPAVPAQGQIFGVFEASLPEYPILVDLKVEILKTSGERVPLIKMKHPGGPFSVPYIAAPGDTLILSILDKDLISQKVGE